MLNVDKTSCVYSDDHQGMVNFEIVDFITIGAAALVLWCGQISYMVIML